MNTNDLKKIRPGEKIYDNKIPGLYAKGNKDSVSLFLIYRNRAKTQKVIKLGKLGVLTLESARSVAQDLLQKVAGGEDPAANWQKQREELTVHELMVKALKEYWSNSRYLESGLFQNILNSVKRYFGKIGSCKLSDLSPRVVDNWHKSFKDIPCAANHILSYLKTAINWAIKNDLIDIKNPCLAVKKFPSNKRSRYATPEEINQIGNFLEKEFKTNPFPAMYLYLILTTGTRPRAIERLMWKNLIIKRNIHGEEVGIVSFFGKTSSKTEENEKIVIPPKTLAMIKTLPHNSEYIIPCGMPKKLWQRIKTKFNLKGLWARDLRRTYATVGLSGGVPLSQVGELLNHKCWETTKVYAKLMDEQRINSAMKIASKIEDIIQH